MAKFAYLARVLSGMSVDKFAQAVAVAHEKSGKPKIGIVIDMVWCAAKYGAGYYDYIIFGFWGLSHAKRKTILTRLSNQKLIEMVDDPSCHETFDQKAKFYRRFAEFLGRDVLIMEDSTKEDFVSFFRLHGTIIVKPDVGWSGKGIRKLEIVDYPTDESIEELYEELVGAGIGVVDEVIIQHDDVARLNPSSVNSIRMTTFVNFDGSPEYIYGAIKMGGEGAFVDNAESGGLHCPLDPVTGKIMGVAHTSALVTHDRHPGTGIEFLGYTIPMVTEAIDLCLKAALVEPGIRYVAWDVAITPTGPLIIEGNDYPGTDFWQLPEYGDLEFGLKEWFQMRVPGF
jgi:hypothetical protein